MKKIDALIISAQTKLQRGVAKLAAKKSGDSQIVVALVLIAVAVGLCIIFRNQIKDIMNNLTTSIGGSIQNLAGSFSEGS